MRTEILHKPAYAIARVTLDPAEEIQVEAGSMVLMSEGSLIVSTYGAIHELELDAGEGVTVDTGHLVAFTEDMGYEARKVGAGGLRCSAARASWWISPARDG